MKRNCQIRIVSSRKTQTGFALVVTLSLMILLAVVSVGLLTLSSVTLRASGQGQAVATARANARLALLLAIGDLQIYAGQDQRITATADIAGTADGSQLSDGVAPLNGQSINKVSKGLTAVQPGTRYWTGVFANQDTPSSIFSKTPSPKIITWLVSGNTTSYPVGGPGILPSDANYAVDATGIPSSPIKAVILVGKNSVGPASTSADRYVAAPLVDVFAKDRIKPAGRFAWWIGDEGVKARINLDQTFKDPTNYAALSAQRRGWETVAGFADYPTPVAGDHQSLSKMITPAETALLVPGAAPAGQGTSPLQSVFHSATAESQAVLADSLNGGTKIDLTAILSSALPNAAAVPGIANYPVKDKGIIPVSAARNIKAPGWNALKDFNDLANSLDAGALLVKAATKAPTGVLTTAAIAPLMTDFRIVFGARIKVVGEEYMTYPCAKLVISIANPYSRPLKWNNDIEIRLSNQTPSGGKSTLWSHIGAYLPQTNNSNDSAVLNGVVFRIKPASLASGEARAYTMDSHLLRTGIGTDVIDLVPVADTAFWDFNNCVEVDNHASNNHFPLDKGNPQGTGEFFVQEPGYSISMKLEMSL